MDHQDDNVYDHPPVLAELSFDDGHSFTWDFRERLAGPDGKFPSIWNFFVESISGPQGESYETSGGYGTGLSVLRLPVPAGATGSFTIRIGDEAGNISKVTGRIGAR